MVAGEGFGPPCGARKMLRAYAGPPCRNCRSRACFATARQRRGCGNSGLASSATGSARPLFLLSVVFFGYFLLDKQKKVAPSLPARRSGVTAPQRRAQRGILQGSPCKTRDAQHKQGLFSCPASFRFAAFVVPAARGGARGGCKARLEFNSRQRVLRSKTAPSAARYFARFSLQNT